MQKEAGLNVNKRIVGSSLVIVIGAPDIHLSICPICGNPVQYPCDYCDTHGVAP